MKIGEVMALHAVNAGLRWGRDGEQIKATAAALHDLRAYDRPRDLPEVQGFYRGMEEFSGMWMVGASDPLPLYWSAADLITREASQEFLTPEVHNSLGFIAMFGALAAERLVDVLRGSGPPTLQHRRAKIGENGSERFAPVLSDDPDFDEAWLVECAATDEHATLITHLDLDENAFDALCDLVEARCEAAKVAYLGGTL